MAAVFLVVGAQLAQVHQTRVSVLERLAGGVHLRLGHAAVVQNCLRVFQGLLEGCPAIVAVAVVFMAAVFLVVGAQLAQVHKAIHGGAQGVVRRGHVCDRGLLQRGLGLDQGRLERGPALVGIAALRQVLIRVVERLELLRVHGKEDVRRPQVRGRHSDGYARGLIAGGADRQGMTPIGNITEDIVAFGVGDRAGDVVAGRVPYDDLRTLDTDVGLVIDIAHDVIGVRDAVPWGAQLVGVIAGMARRRHIGAVRGVADGPGLVQFRTALVTGDFQCPFDVAAVGVVRRVIFAGAVRPGGKSRRGQHPQKQGQGQAQGQHPLGSSVCHVVSSFSFRPTRPGVSRAYCVGTGRGGYPPLQTSSAILSARQGPGRLQVPHSGGAGRRPRRGWRRRRGRSGLHPCP